MPCPAGRAGASPAEPRLAAAPPSRAGGSVPGLLAALLTVSLLAAPVGAQIYRWTDAEGQVHFSQTPPSGVEYQTLEPATAPEDTAEAAEGEAGPSGLQAFLEQRERQRAQAARARAEAQAQQAAERQRRKACAAARARVEQLRSTPPFRLAVRSADGSLARMTPEQHAARLAEAEQDVARHCN